MKGRPFILNKDVVDGRERVQARCGTRKLWVHPDLHAELDAGSLEGYDQNGQLAKWVRCEVLPDAIFTPPVDEDEVHVVSESSEQEVAVGSTDATEDVHDEHDETGRFDQDD